jgi:hypothetical protein
MQTQDGPEYFPSSDGRRRGGASRRLRLGSSLAPEHVGGVAETVHLHVGLAPNPLTVHVLRERQVDVVPLKIEEATQRGPAGEAAAQDVVEDQALMASPGVETQRGVVAEIGACLACVPRIRSEVDSLSWQSRQPAAVLRFRRSFSLSRHPGASGSAARRGRSASR